MNKIMKVVTITIGFSLFVTGCEQPLIPEGAAPGVQVRDPHAPYATVRLNTVNIIDKSLANWHGKEDEKYSKIAVEQTNSRRTATGTLEVWATLRNRTDYPLQIEGRSQFFDSDQAPVEGPTAWQRVFLPANSVATYKEFSTKVEDVAYYYIEIREGR